MRNCKEIDYKAEPIKKGDLLIRLLCSPLYYDKITHIVSAEAFNLRMMGKDKTVKEQYASLGHKENLEKEGKCEGFLQIGYHVCDDKEWEENEYSAFGIFRCEDACKVNPNCVEIHPLLGDNKGHVGLFYAKDENEYYKGPLPTNDVEILEMLNDLSALIADTITQAPERI
jgi:hypothetical protein